MGLCFGEGRPNRWIVGDADTPDAIGIVYITQLESFRGPRIDGFRSTQRINIACYAAYQAYNDNRADRGQA
jgi:hypothetical protein